MSVTFHLLGLLLADMGKKEKLFSLGNEPKSWPLEIIRGEELLVAVEQQDMEQGCTSNNVCPQ